MARGWYFLAIGWLAVLVTAALVAALSFPRVGAAPAEQAPPEAPPEAEAAVALESALTAIHETVAPSVVNLQVIVEERPSLFPGLPGGEAIGIGSGFVWDEHGHIVTNQHVIADATEITVTFMDGVAVPAEVVGADRNSDLAVLRVDPQRVDLRPIAVGNSNDLQVGQIAVAIGNPFGLEGTLTFGIVSALGRALPVVPDPNGPMQEPTGLFQIPDIIQTDASINPGNSGGALVNIRGELIGVPTAIVSPQLGTGGGIGFAVSAAMVNIVVPNLIEHGEHEHPFLGVSMVAMAPPIAREMDLPSEQRGALVAQLTPGGPADQAGLQVGTQEMTFRGAEINVGGDVIIRIADQPVHDPGDLISYLALNVRPGETVTLTILRDGQKQTVNVTVEARPN